MSGKSENLNFIKMKKNLTIIYPVVLMFFFGFSLSCTKSSNITPTPTQGANEVWIQNTSFNPSSISVTINTTVKWTNKDAVAHTVTSDSSIFASGNMNSGDTYSHQFTVAGTYPYHCAYHSMMVAKVIVY